MTVGPGGIETAGGDGASDASGDGNAGDDADGSGESAISGASGEMAVDGTGERDGTGDGEAAEDPGCGDNKAGGAEETGGGGTGGSVDDGDADGEGDASSHGVPQRRETEASMTSGNAPSTCGDQGHRQGVEAGGATAPHLWRGAAWGKVSMCNPEATGLHRPECPLVPGPCAIVQDAWQQLQ